MYYYEAQLLHVATHGVVQGHKGVLTSASAPSLEYANYRNSQDFAYWPFSGRGLGVGTAVAQGTLSVKHVLSIFIVSYAEGLLEWPWFGELRPRAPSSACAARNARHACCA